MKMKKVILYYLLIIALVILCTGCKNGSEEKSGDTTINEIVADNATDIN